MNSFSLYLSFCAKSEASNSMDKVKHEECSRVLLRPVHNKSSDSSFRIQVKREVVINATGLSYCSKVFEATCIVGVERWFQKNGMRWKKKNIIFKENDVVGHCIPKPPLPSIPYAHLSPVRCFPLHRQCMRQRQHFSHFHNQHWTLFCVFLSLLLLLYTSWISFFFSD